ncbi:MAG TPA: hypothetical protein VIV66_14535 [Pyrinomonadaceae bacterium]
MTARDKSGQLAICDYRQLIDIFTGHHFKRIADGVILWLSRVNGSETCFVTTLSYEISPPYKK